MRETEGAIALLSEYNPCPCEARPGWPYLRFTREGRFLAVQEDLVMEGGRALDAGQHGGMKTRTGWRRLGLSAHAEWLAYQECEDGATEVWTYPDAQRLHRFYAGEITNVEFRPDGGQLALLFGRDVPGIYCWTAEDRRLRGLGDPGSVYSFLTYSADSRFLAAAGDDRKIHLWDARTLETVRLSPPHYAIMGLSLNEDGSWFAAGESDDVRIWESAGGLVRSLAIGEPVWRTWFSPKGDLLAVVHDKGVQMWDARSGVRLGGYRFPVQHENFQLAFRPDGGAAVWGNSSRGSGGPWMNPPLGYWSAEHGGAVTTLREYAATELHSG